MNAGKATHIDFRIQETFDETMIIIFSEVLDLWRGELFDHEVNPG